MDNRALFLELANDLRGKLATLGIIADDQDLQTLKNCKKLFDAIEPILEERKKVKSFRFNRSSISRLTGLERETLKINPVYDRIVSYFSDSTEQVVKPSVASPYNREAEIENYKKKTAEYEEKLIAHEKDMADNAIWHFKYDMEVAEHIKTTKTLSQANVKIKELEAQLAEYKAIISRMGGETHS